MTYRPKKKIGVLSHTDKKGQGETESMEKRTELSSIAEVYICYKKKWSEFSSSSFYSNINN